MTCYTLPGKRDRRVGRTRPGSLIGPERMKISGHKTDSMERRYNIVDVDDLSMAKTLMERRMEAAGLSQKL